MDYTTLCAESKEDQEQSAKEMQSLYEVCQQVVDGRCARGKRYELAGLFVVLVLAKLAGMQSLSGASDWVADQEALLRERLHLTWKRMPCANTYSYALARLDSQKVNAAQSYHEFGRLVKRSGGDVVLFVKNNTPATRADLELFFEDSEADRGTWQS